MFGLAPWLVWCLPILGPLSILLYEKCGLEPDLTTEYVVQRMRADEGVSPRLAPAVVLGTCASMLGGASVGKEAAALQAGASLGSLVARPFRLRSAFFRDRGESMEGYAASTGMAATFAALFFSPLGSAFLVMELSKFKRSISRHLPSLVLACFVAATIARAVGIGDALDPVAFPGMSWAVAGQCLVIGAAAAVAGTVFAAAIKAVRHATKRVCANCYLWTAAGGLVFAILVTVFGLAAFTGGGDATANAALHGSYDPWGFAWKMLLTTVCLGFWLKGGEIMPTFCVGALLGAACVVMTGGDAAFGAAMGSMAFFAAFSGCPIAAFLIGCEVFGYGMALWLALAVGLAALASPTLGMYGASLGAALWHLRRSLAGRT